MVARQQASNQDTPPDPETICPKFVAGECPHGVSGKTTKNGVAKCELRHPKRCRKHMKFGADPEHGCNLGDSCEFYHKKEYLKLYNALFTPHLTYCISVWGGISDYKLSKIFTLQKRCIRLLFEQN